MIEAGTLRKRREREEWRLEWAKNSQLLALSQTHNTTDLSLCTDF